MSEIRLNQLTGEWVIIAPERAKRGGNLPQSKDKIDIPRFLETCPFCPGTPIEAGDECHRLNGNDGNWIVRSIVNKYSVLSPTGEVPTSCDRGAVGEKVNGVGLHEVIIEGPEHDLTIGRYPIDHVVRVIGTYLDRFRAFYDDPRIQHVVVFKNHGADAGASQQHPHAQIVGTPIVPGQVVDRLERSRKFFKENGQCLACTLIAQEVA